MTSLLLFMGGGIALDRWQGTSPIFTLIGVALGMVIAGYQLFELTEIGHKNRSPSAKPARTDKLPTSEKE